jgi:hypothetical protein
VDTLHVYVQERHSFNPGQHIGSPEREFFPDFLILLQDMMEYYFHVAFQMHTNTSLTNYPTVAAIWQGWTPGQASGAPL